MVTNASANNASASNLTAAANSKLNEDCGIKEVYASNLYDEFDQMRRIVDKFCFIAMDTEFPGVVARPIGEFKSTADYQYQLLRCNVDLLKLIQVGLTFLSDKGDMPTKYTTWQFNFKFSLGEDMYAQDSIDLLTNSGIKFKKHEEDGIDFLDFAELLMTSGLVLSEKVKWISFHSGYDFGYLLKLLTNCQLPADENEFFELLQLYFPAIYDVKYVMKSCRSLKGGLQEVADQLKIDRIGPQHQAGSDSLLTGLTFFRMKQLFFEDYLDDGLYCGHLFGLGAPYGNGAEPAAPPVPVVDVKNAAATSNTNQVQQIVIEKSVANGSAGGLSSGKSAPILATAAGGTDSVSSAISVSSSSSRTTTATTALTSSAAAGASSTSTSMAAATSTSTSTSGGGQQQQQRSSSANDVSSLAAAQAATQAAVAAAVDATSAAAASTTGTTSSQRDDSSTATSTAES